MGRTRSRCCFRKATIVAFIFTGLVFVGAGVALKLMLKTIIREKVEEMSKTVYKFTLSTPGNSVQLKPGTLVYEEWKNSTSPFYMKFYVFHVKNPTAFYNGRENLQLEERGPYAYRELKSNKILSWKDDHSEVTFLPNRTFIFDREKSCNGCDDKKDTFTTPNIPLMSLAEFMEKINFRGKYPFCYFILLRPSLAVIGPNMFHTKTVHEILWGYDDRVLKAAELVKNLCPVPKGFSSHVQLKHNNTYYGVSSINTGQKDISLLEQYTSWRKQPKMSCWNNKYANMINGTDGSQFKPFITRNDKLRIFSPEICRSVYAVYKSDVEVHGVKLYRFTVPRPVFSSGDIEPDNKGFCPPSGCLASGLHNISRCLPMNPPIIISSPHFLGGDPSLRSRISGLNPDESKHRSRIDIEPMTGITMQASKRLQINVAIRPSSLLRQTNGRFKKTVVPVVHISEGGQITEAKASMFKDKLYKPLFYSKIAIWGSIGFGSLLFLIGVVLLISAVCISRRAKFEIEVPVGVHLQQSSTSRIGARSNVPVKPPAFASFNEAVSANP